MENEQFNVPTNKEIMEIINNHDRINFIMMVNPRRVGVRLFATLLEYNYFEPATPLNGEYLLIITQWEEMAYMIISIPKDYLGSAIIVGKESCVSLSKGVPTLIGVGQFPFYNEETCYTLENTPGHEVYKGGSVEKLLADEDKKCDHIIDTHKAKLMSKEGTLN